MQPLILAKRPRRDLSTWSLLSTDLKRLDLYILKIVNNEAKVVYILSALYLEGGRGGYINALRLQLT